jgi:pimeloyl-ACP methyl ester carboxylesterase
MADAMQVGFRTVSGVRVRFAESTGPSAPSILLTSPWPESVYAFAPIWPSLASVARLVAVDLPGFGRSERRGDLLSRVRLPDHGLGRGRVSRSGTWADRSGDITSNRRR